MAGSAGLVLTPHRNATSWSSASTSKCQVIDPDYSGINTGTI